MNRKVYRVGDDLFIDRGCSSCRRGRVEIGRLQSFRELQRCTGQDLEFIDLLALQHQLHLLLCESFIFNERIGQKLEFLALFG